MWAIRNETPYGAERNWTRDKTGMHHWIVGVQATFRVSESGFVTAASTQLPPPLAPVYYGGAESSSLRRDSELLAIRPCTDIIVENPHAYAPHGRKVESLDVQLRVGPLVKSLVVNGPRHFKETLSGIGMTRSEPFESLPIRYESAYGGADFLDPDPSKHRIDARNPVGKGFATNDFHLIGAPAPSIEYVHGDRAAMGPAGFGPISPAWSPRRERAGTYDDAWERFTKPLLPSDYQELHASSAPDDQRLDNLHGGDWVELVHLTPSAALRFQLPTIELSFVTQFGRRREQRNGRLTAVILATEEMSFSLVWQSVLKVKTSDVAYLDQTLIRLEAASA
jgi:hypothetical protein